MDPDDIAPTGSQEQFAAALTAKLDSLTDAGVSSSPDIGDYENPDSMETQGDALCAGSGTQSPLGSISEFDLTNSPNSLPIPDCDPDSQFTSALLPTYGPLPDPAADPIFDDSMMIGPLFNENGGDCQESGDVPSKDLNPGVCGLRNLGNTCYMNSGLQCILASPSIVEYFLHFNPDVKLSNNDNEDKDLNSKTDYLGLSKQFASLLQQVYSGKYSIIQPNSFKETLSKDHTQFKGFRQHDCQEFLALLLDTLHEQLVSYGSRGATYSMSECTSMELHTPHSTEASCNEGSNVFNFSISGKMFDKESAREGDLDKEFESVSEVCRADLENVNNIDGTESRGSVSPKSYTSYGSSEDKVITNIRMAPIPESIKNEWISCEQSAESEYSRTSTVSTNSEHEDVSEECDTGTIHTNLVSNEQLKKKSVVFSDTVNSFASSEKNNAFNQMNVDIEDFYKEHKTLNVNMNNEAPAMNNKINFDSEKYRLTENTRPSATIENLKTNGIAEKCNNSKRFKCTNVESAKVSENDTKRMRLENFEKNVMMESERKETEAGDCNTFRDPARLKEAIEADKYWEKYLSKNRTVVAHSFQGQFKNTVICSECGHLSVSFEPFMYLSLPLPRALDRQIEVVVCLLDNDIPVTHLITLSQHDRVQHLRDALSAKLNLTERNIVFREVTKHRISRELDDNVWLRFLNTTTRKVYCIEVFNLPTQSNGNLGDDRDEAGCSSLSSSSTSTSTSTGTLTESTVTGGEQDQWKSCNICLDEIPDSDLICHIECTAVLCRDCKERSEQSNPGKCPVCLNPCTDDEWVQLDKSKGVKPPLRMLTTNVLFMARNEGVITKIGHPKLLKLQNIVQLSCLQDVVDKMVKQAVGGDLLSNKININVVSDSGDPGAGSPLSERQDSTGEIILKPADNLAVVIEDWDKNLLEQFNKTQNDISMDSVRVKPELDLTDCLDAFSSKEILDQNNPWFCPLCQKNQTASRTLSVWRYPDYLVIQLKRFVYLEHGPGGQAGSVKLDKKVNFPTSGMDLTPYLSGPLKEQEGETFDLYGAVCHYGSSSGGHYTAYVKHCQNQTWHLFNDSQVEERLPEADNQDDAYILFYKRSGISSNFHFPAKSTN